MSDVISFFFKKKKENELNEFKKIIRTNLAAAIARCTENKPAQLIVKGGSPTSFFLKKKKEINKRKIL